MPILSIAHPESETSRLWDDDPTTGGFLFITEDVTSGPTVAILKDPGQRQHGYQNWASGITQIQPSGIRAHWQQRHASYQYLFRRNHIRMGLMIWPLTQAAFHAFASTAHVTQTHGGAFPTGGTRSVSWRRGWHSHRPKAVCRAIGTNTFWSGQHPALFGLYGYRYSRGVITRLFTHHTQSGAAQQSHLPRKSVPLVPTSILGNRSRLLGTPAQTWARHPLSLYLSSSTSQAGSQLTGFYISSFLTGLLSSLPDVVWLVAKSFWL